MYKMLSCVAYFYHQQQPLLWSEFLLAQMTGPLGKECCPAHICGCTSSHCDKYLRAAYFLVCSVYTACITSCHCTLTCSLAWWEEETE